jgi:beta-glucosidase
MVAENATHTLLVGRSAHDVRLVGAVTVTAATPAEAPAAGRYGAAR